MSKGIFAARTGFVATIDGKYYVIRKGATVRAGHPLMKGRKELFEEFKVDYDLKPKRQSGKK